MSLKKQIFSLVKEFLPDVVKTCLRHGINNLINDLKRKYLEGKVSPQEIEEIARLLEYGAETLRQIYGATGDQFMNAIRQKAKVSVREIEDEEK